MVLGSGLGVVCLGLGGVKRHRHTISATIWAQQQQPRNLCCSLPVEPAACFVSICIVTSDSDGSRKMEEDCGGILWIEEFSRWVLLEPVRVHSVYTWFPIGVGLVLVVLVRWLADGHFSGYQRPIAFFFLTVFNEFVLKLWICLCSEQGIVFWIEIFRLWTDKNVLPFSIFWLGRFMHKVSDSCLRLFG